MQERGVEPLLLDPVFPGFPPKWTKWWTKCTPHHTVPVMLNSTAKKGRPQGYHRTAWGENIQGLTRLADGRWKVSGPKPVKFSEPDERLAVARFHKIMADRAGNQKSLIPMGTFKDAGEAAKKMLAGTKHTFIARIPANGGPIKVSRSFDTTEAWAWFREQILTRPKWVAERVGIEQIGYLTDVKRPTLSPKLTDLGELYAEKPDLSSNEASRSRLFWKEFCKAVDVEAVRDITHDEIAKYEATILAKGHAPKSILHRHRKIRTILAHAIKRGRGVEDCRRALDITAMLEVKDAHPLDPKPISVADFWKIHAAAEDAGDTTYAALMLTALNAAMYGGEIAALKGEEVDLSRGELVTRRSKTGVSRVAVLWPEVIKALKKIERRGDYVFNTSRRSYVVNSVLKMWRKYREAAGLTDSTTFGQVRDAGFTIACRSASLDQARVLAGHRLPGATDFYVRRNPQFVTDACKAIRGEFYKKGK